MANIEKKNARFESNIARVEMLQEIVAVNPVEILPKKTVDFLQTSEISITEFRDGSSGKMFLVPAVTTCCLLNARCLERIKAGIGVCAYCYAATGNVYNAALARDIHNTRLFETIISKDVINRCAAELVRLATKGMMHNGRYYEASMQVRFESKGDTQNAIHAYNYYRLAAAIHAINSDISVTVWTKNPDHYESAIRIFDICDNDVAGLRVIYSALEKGAAGLEEAERVKAQYDFIVGAFVVYDDGKKGATEDADNYNAEYVKRVFGPMTNNHVVACRCKFGSCRDCKACYRCAEFTIMFENLR